MKNFLMPFTFLLISGCASSYETPVPQAKDVELKRFMGKWYVIANIPTFIEKGAHNAVENYEMNEDGTIKTTFSFNKNSFDGEQKVYQPTGYVSPHDTSKWGMQFIWPFKAEYIIAYLGDDYQHTIIARNARDYVWVMARSPQLDEEIYRDLIKRTVAMGYKEDLILKVPQLKK